MIETKPTCLGFIMDGNRRWAAEQNLPSVKGHLAGRNVLHTCISWAKSESIEHVVVYAFSTENWKRSEEEVAYLLDLFGKELQSVADKEVNIRIVGRRQDFSKELNQEIDKVEENNSEKYQTTVWIACSYGGRAELIAAANEAIKLGKVVDEETFEAMMWTADLPEPDMIVRTGGEKRLSNFLTWKSTYSELHFIDKHWPALTKTDFDDILVEYEGRQRRQGK